MKVIISILAVVIFFTGAWYIGNAVMETFGMKWQEQFMSTLYGVGVIGYNYRTCYNNLHDGVFRNKVTHITT